MSVRWRRWLGLVLFSIVALVVAIGIVFETGIAERWVRHIVVNQIEQRTGARVSLGGFHLHAWHLRAEFDDLTLHGLEAPTAPPLFHAAHVNLAIRILSLFGGEIAIDELVFDQPQLSVRFDKDGKSNLPTPRVPRRNRPWRETLFSLRIGHLEFRDGSATLNDRSIPLAMLGKDLEFDLHLDARPPGAGSYVGSLKWQQIELAARRDAPFRFDISAKFTLHPDAFELDDLALKLPHSDLNLRAELPSFARSDWNLHYRGRLTLADVRTIFRSPLTPDGIADFSGEARYASGEWTTNGHYQGHDIAMTYQWFHARGLESWGDYEMAKKRLVVPKLNVRAFGGSVTGHLEMDTDTLAFRTETQLRGMSLGAALAAVQNTSFPVVPLHWDGRIDVDSVNTWTANFLHFRSKGESRWSPPETLAPGMIPVTARIEYDTSEDGRGVALGASEISTPKTKIEMAGFLGAGDSALDLKVKTDDVLGWDDFINVIRGADSAPSRIAGALTFRGRIDGPLGGPTFTGHLNATDARFDNFYFESLDGDLEYSPDDFRLTKTRVRRGQATADVNVSLELDGSWGFSPESGWTFDAQLAHAPTGELQELFGMKFPAKGLLSGTFHGSGTRMAPMFDANFTLEDVDAKGVHLDRIAGLLHLSHDEYRLSNVEIRSGPGRVSGDILYQPVGQKAEFNLAGTNIPLDKIGALQSQSIPVSGRLDFDIRGNGPVLSPVATGNVRLVGLQVGPDVQGNFRGRIASDGENARMSLVSEINAGRLQGEFSVGLHGDNQVTGQLTVKQLQMDAFIVSGLHLKQLTGHSSVDGRFTLSGALRRPETIEMGADIDEISFNYDLVELKNDGPIRLTYRRNEVRIDQAHLHGPNTDLQFSGSARFDRDRPMHFSLAGSVNLRFLDRVIPDLFALGRADVNVSVEGTMSRPRITGRASLKDASATYSDFPVGLSHVSGDLVFDRNRMLFDRITAQAGGGQLQLNGAVNYGEGPLRYELNASTTVVRIRYPAGMSWLASGALQLSGTSTAAILSGKIQIQRLLLAEGVDVASLFVAASETSASPAASSALMRNLTFDIEGQTTPGARIEWGGAQLEVDGNVRLRGTWDRPVLLGHIHLLGGEMAFRGNNYQLTRGDVNFANPFRLDPVLNVEATSTIGQYQVTINFSGPASRLSLSYRSDPPLPDSDIIALLAIGSTGQESGLRSSGAGSQNYGATALLSEAISSGLGGRIERLFGISHFRVDPFLAGTATESNAAARVTIQQQFTRNLTVTYSTNAATTNQYQLIQVEYAIKRDVSVIFVRDINGTYAFEVRFVRHFK
ncbi:MAG: translocation/assembly module TamB domain-containing protein [Candidatus Acidiferrales bacterium]